MNKEKALKNQGLEFREDITRKGGNKIEDYCKNRIIEIKTLSYYMGGDSSYATLCSIDTFYFYG